MDDASEALIRLGRALNANGYHFVTGTPETHRRVNCRPGNADARTLRDVFGWNRRFRAEVLPPAVFDLAEAAGIIRPVEEEHGAAEGYLASSVRFSTLGGALFAHSSYPTTCTDAVFFGPDTYRFCAFVAREIGTATRVVDVGCGTGAGGIVAAASGARVVLTDVNAEALRYARINARLAGVDAEIASSDVLASVTGAFDVVVANPPYMLDGARRTYRDGGGALGEGLSVRIVREALAKLGRGGRLLLYTGVAIVDGVDPFARQIAPRLEKSAAHYDYREVDPDVFGEELESPAYAEVERIAAVTLSVVV